MKIPLEKAKTLYSLKYSLVVFKGDVEVARGSSGLEEFFSSDYLFELDIDESFHDFQHRVSLLFLSFVLFTGFFFISLSFFFIMAVSGVKSLMVFWIPMFTLIFSLISLYKFFKVKKELSKGWYQKLYHLPKKKIKGSLFN